MIYRILSEGLDFVCFRVLGLPNDFKSGVVFSTYATLVSTVQKGGELLAVIGQLNLPC